MRICERIGPVLAQRPTVFSSTGIDMYYALTLGYQISKRDALKHWAFAGGDNFANIFDRRAQAFLQIANANRIVIDTGLNLPSMLWASQWEPERAVLAYCHLDTVLDVGLVRRGRLQLPCSVTRSGDARGHRAFQPARLEQRQRLGARAGMGHARLCACL